MGEVEAITPPRQGRWRRRGKSEDENSRDDSGSPSPPLRRKKGISSRPGMMLSKDDSDPSLLKPIKMTGTPTMFRRKRSTGSSAHQEESIPENGELERTKNKFRMFGKLRRGKAKGASTDEEDNNNNVRSAPSRTVSFDFQVDELRASSDHPRSYMTSDAYTPPRGGKAGGGGFSLDCIEGSSPYGGSTTANSTDSMLSYVDPVRSNSFDSSSLHRPGERARYSVHHGSRGGKKKFRVRPYRCFSEPVYMTEEEIYADSLKPSQDFEFLKTYLAPTFRYLNFEEVPPVIEEMWGSPKDDGRIGSLRMEVLGAISLARQKPDVCVYVVCGDTAFTTDVLTGYRSPMWPCQSKRAGVFPIHHAYAKVFIGVFDVKARKNKENDVFCGRIVLDIATLRPDTEYDITFPLRASSFIYDRKPRGVLRLRFSLHWFNERAALFSYFKGPKSITRSSPLADGQPTIPCADPKTFRNLALTIHGQDLPGKYSRVAFRATMREFNLYQQNLRHLVKVLILDAIMYENPFISLYLFLASMHCVYLASIAMVPPYFVGYILILFWLNHRHYISSPDYNLGYRPLTAFEIAKGLLFHSVPGQNNYEAILLHKRTKKRRVKASRAAQKLRRLDSMEGSVASENNDEDGEIEALDHREFPFSERNTYAHFAVEHSLAPSKSNRRGSTTRLHGRLSVYYSSEPPGEGEGNGAGDEELDDSDEDSDRDDETVMSESNLGDMIYGDFDGEDDDLMDMEISGMQQETLTASSLFQSGESNAKRRIRPGPPQDNDVSTSKRIPPQVHLMRVETLLHKISKKVAVEMIHTMPTEDKDAGKDASGAELSASAKKRKVVMDEFDKLLGLQFRSANPVTRIASSFLGPLMRMFRIFLFLVRISFNISTWRDPYLSFLVFVALSILCLVLVVFPWRTFLFFASVGAVGPQNLGLRLYLEKKARDKKRKEEEAAMDLSQRSQGYGYEDAMPSSAHSSSENESKPEPTAPTKNETGTSSGFFGFGGKSKKSKTEETYLEDELGEKIERPPFGDTSRKLQPRPIIIPYSRFKKDRFYDWPPDPTVSRATPIAAALESLRESTTDLPGEQEGIPESTNGGSDHIDPDQLMDRLGCGRLTRGSRGSMYVPRTQSHDSDDDEMPATQPVAVSIEGLDNIQSTGVRRRPRFARKGSFTMTRTPSFGSDDD